MSASKGSHKSARKNGNSRGNKTESSRKDIDYSDLEGLREHPLSAVRRGLYARHLAQARARAQISGAALAEALGVTRATVGQWEQGQTGLSWLDARRIGQLLNVDPHLLYDDPELRKGAMAVQQERATPFNDAAPVVIEGARWWRIDGSVLQHQGVLNGDLVAVQAGHHVADGDLALLAAAAADGSTWNTLRLRTGGYFVGHGPATPPEPIPHEPGSVAIRGTAVALFRPLAKMAGEGPAES